MQQKEVVVLFSNFFLESPTMYFNLDYKVLKANLALKKLLLFKS
jgi:hypothetical protein